METKEEEEKKKCIEGAIQEGHNFLALRIEFFFSFSKYYIEILKNTLKKYFFYLDKRCRKKNEKIKKKIEQDLQPSFSLQNSAPSTK